MNPKNKMAQQPDEEPRYVISVAARILRTQTYTLRYYERIGIIEPSRSAGNIRLYSESDIVKLRRVKALIEELGVNLAGVEVIMHMVERIGELQQQVEELEKTSSKRNKTH
jgi:MerR family transcriptional regulator/heat shock protein HspR